MENGDSFLRGELDAQESPYLQPRVQGFRNPPDGGGENVRAGAAGPSKGLVGLAGRVPSRGAEALRGRGWSRKRGLETHLDVGLALAALDVALAAAPPGTRPDRGPCRGSPAPSCVSALTPAHPTAATAHRRPLQYSRISFEVFVCVCAASDKRAAIDHSESKSKDLRAI